MCRGSIIILFFMCAGTKLLSKSSHATWAQKVYALHLSRYAQTHPRRWERRHARLPSWLGHVVGVVYVVLYAMISARVRLWALVVGPGRFVRHSELMLNVARIVAKLSSDSTNLRHMVSARFAASQDPPLDP